MSITVWTVGKYTPRGMLYLCVTQIMLIFVIEKFDSLLVSFDSFTFHDTMDSAVN